MVRPIIRALPWGVLALVSACALSTESPPRAEAHQIPEFQDHGIAVPPGQDQIGGRTKNGARSEGSIAADGFDLLRSLVVTRGSISPLETARRGGFVKKNNPGKCRG